MISKRESKSLPYVLTVIDLGAVILAFSMAFVLRFKSSILPAVPLDPTDVSRYLYLMIGLLPLWWFDLAYFKLYSSQYLLHGNDEYRRVINAATTATVHTMVVIYLLKIDFARGWVLLSWVTGMIFLLCGRLLHRQIHRLLISRGVRRSPLILIGANTEAKKLADEIDSVVGLGVRVAGAVAWPMREPASGLKILGNLDDLSEVISRERAEAALVVPSALPAATLQGLYHSLARAGVAVYISPSLFDIMASRATVLPISDMPLIRLQEVEFSGIKYAIKRTGDFFGALVLLAPLSLLFLGLSILIKLQSPGPAFFKQERVGRRGRLFMLYKFRTMVVDAEARQKELLHLNEAIGPIFKIRDDPRLTPVGKWLRKYSLDELPQLINVLLGQMSMVGPRPPIPSEVATYGDYERRRLDINPGMTGLWQVRGRSDTTFEEMVRLDLYYIENWSPALDVYILYRTLGVVLSGKGAY